MKFKKEIEYFQEEKQSIESDIKVMIFVLQQLKKDLKDATQLLEHYTYLSAPHLERFTDGRGENKAITTGDRSTKKKRKNTK